MYWGGEGGVWAPVPMLSTTATLYYIQKNIYIVSPKNIRERKWSEFKEAENLK